MKFIEHSNRWFHLPNCRPFLLNHPVHFVISMFCFKTLFLVHTNGFSDRFLISLCFIVHRTVFAWRLMFADGVIRRDAQMFSRLSFLFLLSNTRLACEISVPVDTKLWTAEPWMPQFVLKLPATIWFFFYYELRFFVFKHPWFSRQSVTHAKTWISAILNFRFSPCIIIVSHFYCPTNALNATKFRG